MTKEELKVIKAIRELCDKASPGPWTFGLGYEQAEPGPWISSKSSILIADGGDRINADENNLTVDDYRFIAAARTFVPKLLDEIERLNRMHDTSFALIDHLTGGG